MKSIQHKLLLSYDEDVYAFWREASHGSSNVMRSALVAAFVRYVSKTSGFQLDQRQYDYMEQSIRSFQVSKDTNTVYRAEFMQFIEKLWKVGSKKQKLFKYDFPVQPVSAPSAVLTIRVFSQQHRLLKTYSCTDREVRQDSGDSSAVNNLITIGSDPQHSDIVIDSPTVNGRHLIIQHLDGKFLVQDVSKSNFAKFLLMPRRNNILQNDMAIQVGLEDIFSIEKVSVKKQ